MSAPKPPVAGALLSEQDAATYLGTTPRHVRELRTTGRLTFIRVGRFIRFAPADLDAFIAARRVRASRS